MHVQSGYAEWMCVSVICGRIVLVCATLTLGGNSRTGVVAGELLEVEVVEEEQAGKDCELLPEGMGILQGRLELVMLPARVMSFSLKLFPCTSSV